jgi:Amt family ammonium transporter
MWAYFHGVTLVASPSVVFAFLGSLILYKLTDLIIPLRVTPEQELEGLDRSQYGETALGADLLGGLANGKPASEAIAAGV